MRRRSQYVFASLSKETPLFLLVGLREAGLTGLRVGGEPAPEQVHEEGVGSVREGIGGGLKSRGNYKTDCQLHNNAYNSTKKT